MSLDEGISRLIQRIYCAGCDAAAWDAVALNVLTLTGGCAALTTVVDLKNREFSTYRFYGPDDTACARGVEEYAEVYVDDPSLIWASQNPTARFCDSSKTAIRGDYLGDPFVRWNRARFGSTHWYVGYTQPEDELSFSFSVHFPASQGPGTHAELSLFRLLFDHMESAVRLGRRPFNAESDRSLILLDAGGCVRGVSNGAQALLRGPGAISLNGKRLITARPAEQASFDKAIGAALNTAAMGTRPSAIQLHPDHGRPWIIVLKPILSSYGPFGQIRCELLLEVHEGLPRIGSIELLKSLYALSEREMQLVRLLADGHSLESAAQVLSIGDSTVRTHLRAIFTKTTTTRQSELMHLCAGLSQH